MELKERLEKWVLLDLQEFLGPPGRWVPLALLENQANEDCRVCTEV